MGLKSRKKRSYAWAYAYAVNQMLRVRRRKGCSVFYGLVASFKAAKRKANVGDAWFRVSPLSVCLSVSLSLSIGVLVCGLSSAFFWSASLSRNLSFISFFSSDRIRSGFLCFYREGHGLAEKLLLIIFIFWQISSTFRYALILCAEAPFFHF